MTEPFGWPYHCRRCLVGWADPARESWCWCCGAQGERGLVMTQYWDETRAAASSTRTVAA